ncbi:hypothetical protein [Pseudomonas sp. MN1F]|uniref:hypothetical protein n=1 Tax=Pseudomonas sp. MN1F TaxID=1366632 RepID=UPI00128ED914|nr:hypothetical protein [Pseudomonas sp. MN1F]MQG94755.1 hypothetical protein [Pseudomonas sp. MN1F]
MSEPLNIEISKFQRSIGNNQSIATYQQGDGVVVQLWEGQKLVYHDLMTYEEYAVYRAEVPEYGLLDYPPPENHESREAGGTKANGNTIGRVVGEASSKEMPAAEANTPLVPETEQEEGWWSSASPWVHGTLDGLGFIPGLGAFPDAFNAVIYAIEGDIENAGLATFAAIPVIGDAAKAGVLVGKTAKKAGSHTTREAIEGAGENTTKKGTGGQGKRKRNSDKCKPLENGVPGNDYRGGKHSKIRQGGKNYTPLRESHHMPAASAYSRLNGKTIKPANMPTIQMDKADHMLTKSWGSSLSAQSYRLEQERLIKSGKAGYTAAMMMDITDIREKFGDKYAPAIAQMIAWSACKGYI